MCDASAEAVICNNSNERKTAGRSDAWERVCAGASNSECHCPRVSSWHEEFIDVHVLYVTQCLVTIFRGVNWCSQAGTGRNGGPKKGRFSGGRCCA